MNAYEWPSYRRPITGQLYSDPCQCPHCQAMAAPIPRFRYEDGRIFDREWTRPGYVLKVWAVRSDGNGLTDHGPDVDAESARLVALLNWASSERERGA